MGSKLNQNAPVILHIDADCFYAQVEEIRNPALRGKPVGVTQKFLVVTCNYEARKFGVGKLMSISEAKRRCPQLVLVNGEDLSPYRKTSQAILKVLQSYGAAKKLGLDEAFVDITDEVRKRRTECKDLSTLFWEGHLHCPAASKIQEDNKQRTLDLRVVRNFKSQDKISFSLEKEIDCESTIALKLGSIVSCEIRKVVKTVTGIRTSAGISHSCMISKLISGLFKPDDQTILLPQDAQEFVAPLPVRALPSVGRKLEKELHENGIFIVGDIIPWEVKKLQDLFGEKTSLFLYQAARGVDDTIVRNQEEPKRVSVEDSFQECSGFHGATRILHRLAPDLIQRLDEDRSEYRRNPRTLQVTWRHKSSGVMGRVSASAHFPSSVFDEGRSTQERAAKLVNAALSLLKNKINEPFYLTLLNLAAINFTKCGGSTISGYVTRDLQEQNQQEFSGIPPSKHALRRKREELNPYIKEKELISVDGEDEAFWSDLMIANSDPVAKGDKVVSKKLCKRGSSYRNEEALAIENLFKDSKSFPIDDIERDPSLSLALKLQQEEVQASKAGPGPKKSIKDFFKH